MTITDEDRAARNALLKTIDCMGDDEDCFRIDQAFARHRITGLERAAVIAEDGAWGPDIAVVIRAEKEKP